VWLATSALVGFLGHMLLKALIDRPRPDWPDALASASTAAMPSGHAASGIDAWVVLGVILLVGATGARRVPAIAVIVAGLLMGPSRLLLGVHWPSDVLAGWLYGIAIACLTAAAVLVAVRARRLS
jgi:undecaprenyl-diphosphatase